MRKTVFIVSAFLMILSLSFFISCNNGADKEPTVSTSSDSLTAVIERGRYIANNVAVCLHCHSQLDTSKFSLPVLPGTEGGGGVAAGAGEGIPGELTPPNITPFALKDWTDDEITRAITQGINKKGDTLFPLMPYHNYSKLSKEDINSVIAYLRTLKPIEATTAPKKLFITPEQYGPLPANMLAENKIPDPSDKVKYGEYLTTMASCSDCHTPMTQQGPDFSKMFAGGFTFDIGFMKVTTANITPDSATGIGSWTEEMFLQKFKSSLALFESGMRPGRNNTMMPWSMYAKMKEDDLKAIYAFLRTVPPISNKVEKWAK